MAANLADGGYRAAKEVNGTLRVRGLESGLGERDQGAGDPPLIAEPLAARA